MKGLILSGGLGTRLKPLTLTQPKQIIPVGNKPILFYAIEAMAACNINDIGIIIGHTGEEIKKVVGDGTRWGVRITYIYQSKPLGLAHAVKTAEDFINQDSFVLYLGDNLLEGGLEQVVNQFKNCNALILVNPVTDPSRYGIAELDGDRVISLVEKPKQPKSNLALVGVYVFDQNIFRAIDHIQPSWRNELEITDAIQWLVSEGLVVKPSVLSGWWRDTGKVEDLIDANRLLLEKLNIGSDMLANGDSKVIGQVMIAPTAKIEKSLLHGPIIIGDGAEVISSIVGPYTSIGDGCIINHSQVENSILLNGSRLDSVPYLVCDSLIGVNAIVRGQGEKPNSFSVVLSDYSSLVCNGGGTSSLETEATKEHSSKGDDLSIVKAEKGHCDG